MFKKILTVGLLVSILVFSVASYAGAFMGSGQNGTGTHMGPGPATGTHQGPGPMNNGTGTHQGPGARIHNGPVYNGTHSGPMHNGTGAHQGPGYGTGTHMGPRR